MTEPFRIGNYFQAADVTTDDQRYGEPQLSVNGIRLPYTWVMQLRDWLNKWLAEQAPQYKRHENFMKKIATPEGRRRIYRADYYARTGR